MVKQSSFFSRLADRFRTGSQVKVQPVRGNGNEPARPAPARVEPPVVVTPQAAEMRTTRKLNEREEAMVALGSHFQELTGLMRGVQSRMDTQVGKLVDAADSLRQLPGIGSQQLELLRGLASQMEKQNTLGEQVARTLSTLPALLNNVEAALQRAATTDERTAATMRDFQGTMDRIHASMAKMVEHSGDQAAATRELAQQREESLKGIAAGMEQAQREAVKELRSAADDGMASLRRSHEDQSNRLQKVVQEHAGWNRAVLIVLGVVVLGLIALITMQMVK